MDQIVTLLEAFWLIAATDHRAYHELMMEKGKRMLFLAKCQHVNLSKAHLLSMKLVHICALVTRS
jgi:predicted transcriptional regulator